ncbi:hypothetical protein SLEP1_g9369 [Rubroshorea leprosula]|uniref:RING-type domain-containing protein n=1 Tax=Rubroshorea leprosula TaxID=152421 RepID=A0AAV5IE05_9ROSI|nr:hypothetical protein SLEP1_g9369 [Rubroshorea leprosula]
MMKQEQMAQCGSCNAKDVVFLHNIRQRGIFRRFCTNCVLKSHLGLFCPICLEVFSEPPPAHQRLICFKCPAICHRTCPSQFSNSSAFICPTCYNPGFNFFNVNPDNRSKPGPVHELGKDEGLRFIEKEASKALLAAAKLSAVSMTKAAANLRMDAERKVKEAALARKRARDALERLAFFAAKENVENGREKGPINGPVVTKSRVDAQAETKRNGLSEDKGSNGLHSVSPVNATKLQR